MTRFDDLKRWRLFRSRKKNIARRLNPVPAIAVALTVVAVAVAGCGGDSDDSSDKGATSGNDLSGESVVFTTFGGAVGEALKTAFGDPVAEATGLKISYDSPSDYAKLEAQVETGNVSWNVVQADAFWERGFCEELLEPRPKDVDISGIDPSYLGDCGVPGETWSTTLGYDSTKFESDPPTSWADLFDTDKYPGKRAMWGSFVGSNALEAALLADGVAPDDLYPLDLDRAYAKLDTIRDDITFFDTVAQFQQLMQNHEVVMAPVTGNQNGYRSGFTPVWKDAILSWDEYVVPKGGGSAGATAILNEIASKAGQERFALIEPFGSTTKSPIAPPSAEETSPSFREWSLAVPEHRKAAFPMDQKYWADNFDALQTQWIDWVQGG